MAQAKSLGFSANSSVITVVPVPAGVSVLRVTAFENSAYVWAPRARARARVV